MQNPWSSEKGGVGVYRGSGARQDLAEKEAGENERELDCKSTGQMTWNLESKLRAEF